MEYEADSAVTKNVHGRSNMFEELDKYIKEFEIEDFAVDYWYDEGVLIAEDILQKFENNDWESLIQVLPKRTIGWKRRLAYCLHDFGDLKQLEILLVLIDTADTELFEISVDSLRSFKDNQTMIQNNAQSRSSNKESISRNFE